MNNTKKIQVPQIPESFNFLRYESECESKAQFLKLRQYFDKFDERIRSCKGTSIPYEKMKEDEKFFESLRNPIIRTSLDHICRVLTHEKISRPITNDTDLNNGTSTKKLKLLSQKSVINDLWYYCIFRVEMFFTNILDKYSELNSKFPSQYYIYFNSGIWSELYDLLLQMLPGIEPIINYFLSNYEMIVNEKKSYNSADQLMLLILSDVIIRSQDDKFPIFFEECFTELRRNGDTLETLPIFPYGPMSQLNSHYDIPKIYLNCLQNYYQRLRYNPIPFECLEDMEIEVKKAIEIEYFFASQIFNLDKMKAVETFLKLILFQDDIFKCLANHYYNNEEYGWFGNGKFKKEIISFYNSSVQFKVKRSMKIFKIDQSNDLPRLIQNFIEKRINDSYKSKNNSTLIYEICKLRSYFPDGESEKAIRTSVNKVLQGSFSMTDFYMSELKIAVDVLENFVDDLGEARNCRDFEGYHPSDLYFGARREDYNGIDDYWNDEHVSSDDELGYIYSKKKSVKHVDPNWNSGDKVYLHRFFVIRFIEIPKILDLPLSFLKVLSIFFFRELVMKGQKFIKLFKYWHLLPARLVNNLSSYYSKSDEIIGLTTLINEIHDLNKWSSSYKTIKSSDIACDIIILQGSKYNDMFSENESTSIVLPYEIEKKWRNVLKYYQENTKNGTMKSIRPAYQLQHCEVSSPYKTSDGEPITFGLTLYQTCVLNEFNNETQLSFNELHIRTKIEKQTLQTVLKSFVAVGLMIKNDAYVTLNDNYAPDPSKIKDGKVIIPLGKTILKQNSSATSRSSSNNHIEHPEGLSSQWKQELLRAAITRTLKVSSPPEVADNALMDAVKEQVHGCSVGEYKDAMKTLLRDKFIAKHNEEYIYNFD